MHKTKHDWMKHPLQSTALLATKRVTRIISMTNWQWYNFLTHNQKSIEFYQLLAARTIYRDNKSTVAHTESSKRVIMNGCVTYELGDVLQSQTEAKFISTTRGLKECYFTVTDAVLPSSYCSWRMTVSTCTCSPRYRRVNALVCTLSIIHWKCISFVSSQI